MIVGADVLAEGLGRVHQLRDLRELSIRGEDGLHLLVSQLLDVVDGEQDARAAVGEQGLLDAHRVHGVAVDQQRALREVVTGQPERVGVVPLLGLVVVHEGDLDAVLLLEGVLALLDRARRGSRRRS